MDQNNKKQAVGATGHSHGSASSATTNLDHLFGPRDSSSSASSSLFGSIFPPPSSTGPGRERGSGNTARGGSKGSVYPNNEGGNPPCNFNSSIYYGGQENYNVPKSGSTYESKNTHQQNLKKDGGDDGDSRGNWWKGSLYY